MFEPSAIAQAVIETDRLRLRRPTLADAQEVYQAHASEPKATRYMAWQRHNSVEVSKVVMQLWEDEWRASGVGAYLVCDRDTNAVIGSTGLHLRNPLYASTGYILAQEQWGKGLASEALGAMVSLSIELGLQRLDANCHFEHHASAHVLEKNGFRFEGRLSRYLEFPNLEPGTLKDVLLYARTL